MSRTHKDAPGARKARADRKFAEREIPFDYQPAPVLAGADDWDAFADPTLARDQRFAAAARLHLIADPDSVTVRAELTAIAGGLA